MMLMIFSSIKKILYRLPGIVSLYHFCFAFCAAFFYGFPGRKIFVIGVTGTKGKTTVVHLMDAILEAAGKKTALLSSVMVKIGDKREKNASDMTMPGRFFVQKFLRQAVTAGCEYAILEVTSQGVLQHRHRFIRFARAFMINIHPEHIEAHGSFEAYRKAKLDFLRYAGRKGALIFINADDKNANFFRSELHTLPVRLYSLRDTFTEEIAANATRLALSDFNKENISAAVSLARDIGIKDEVIRLAIRDFSGVPGRMDYAQTKPFSVVVDYAHTPDSLEAVYRALKPKKENLICVLGSAGGGRDKWKRPALGEIASRYCTKIILTNEDPYEENPADITREIGQGIPQFKLKEVEIYNVMDRGEAIKEAIDMAQKDDVVVITGKGSEEWIHAAGGKKIPWSDKEITEEILRNKKATSL